MDDASMNDNSTITWYRGQGITESVGTWWTTSFSIAQSYAMARHPHGWIVVAIDAPPPEDPEMEVMKLCPEELAQAVRIVAGQVPIRYQKP